MEESFKSWLIFETKFSHIKKVASDTGLNISSFSKEELMAGFEVEREHDGKMGKDIDVVRSDADILRIVLAHLRETPNYYKKLKKAGL